MEIGDRFYRQTATEVMEVDTSSSVAALELDVEVDVDVGCVWWGNPGSPIGPLLSK